MHEHLTQDACDDLREAGQALGQFPLLGVGQVNGGRGCCFQDGCLVYFGKTCNGSVSNVNNYLLVIHKYTVQFIHSITGLEEITWLRTRLFLELPLKNEIFCKFPFF